MGLFSSNSTFASVVSNLISLFNVVVGALSALALVLFFWGVVRFIYHSDDTQSRQEGRSSIMWGLIALFVLFSLFGILQLLSIAFFGGNLGSSGGTTSPCNSADCGGGYYYPGTGSTGAL